MSQKKKEALTGTTKEFLDLFQSLCYRHQAWQVWENLVTAFACSISNTIDLTPEHYKEREEMYESSIKKIEDFDTATKLFAVTAMALEKNPEQDFLGDIFMRLNLNGHYKGQFFTPYHICELMAKTTQVAENTDKEYISVMDPTCGAGAMLIAGINEMRKNGICYHEKALFIGQDIDRIVGLMCYIQISLLGAAGYVCIGNTLTNPVTGPDLLLPVEMDGQDIWYTPMFFFPKWHARREEIIKSLTGGNQALLSK